MMARHLPRRARRTVLGLTLVEMMVSIAIGMLIVTAMSLLFANNSRSRGETERAARKIENGRFALEMLRTELEHAGFYAVLDPRKLALPAAKPDACATAIGDLKTALGVYIQGYDNTAGGLSCIPDVKAGTDVLVLRRASSCVAGAGTCPALPAGAVAFQASSCNESANNELSNTDVANHYRLSTVAGDLTLHKRNCSTTAEIYRYVVRVYFIANNDKAGDGVPTLKRAELATTGGAVGFTTVSLVQGVENMQLEYGLDTNGDGSPDVDSASPDIYLNCTSGTTPTCVGHWTSVVTAKVHLLTRSVEPTPGHVDSKSYVLGRVADITAGTGAAHTVAAANDPYKRSVFQEVVRLQNASGRRATP